MMMVNGVDEVDDDGNGVNGVDGVDDDGNGVDGLMIHIIMYRARCEKF